MDLNLAGRHALVCGASEGIGRATARELAALGADVSVMARRAEALEAVVADLPRKPGQRHDVLVADVSRLDELRTRVDALVASRPVHILVNNTGGPPGGPVFAATAEAFLDAFGKHLLANQALAQATVPGMRAAGWGRIVNVVSTSVYEPIPGLGVSNTIRGAVAGWAKTLARELGVEYACLALVANWAAGCGDEAEISLEEIYANLEHATAQVPPIVRELLSGR